MTDGPSGAGKSAIVHHLETEIRPHMEAGRTVVSDRYVPSGLVMQRF